MSTLGTVERPLCVAVVGSGPSGFYAAEALLKAPNLTVRGMCSIGCLRRSAWFAAALHRIIRTSRASPPPTRRWPLTHLSASLAT